MRIGKALVICALLWGAGGALAQDDPDWESGEPEASAEISSGGRSSNREGGTRGPGGITDRGEHVRPYGISAMAYLPWYYGIGIGFNARFEIPIVHDGFISAINDQVSIEPSFSLGYRGRHYGFANDRVGFFDIVPGVYGMWSFHITPKFRPYGAIGLGYVIAVTLDDYPGRDVNGHFFWWDTVIGMFYNFHEHLSFRAELGSWGPKAGLTLLF